MKAKLIEETPNRMFYELTEPIHTGKNLLGQVDIVKELAELKAALKRKGHILADGIPSECTLICISDAQTHAERLVFVAARIKGRLQPLISMQIGGQQTMMMHGGDRRSMREPEVYLRRLAMLNKTTIAL